MWIPWIIYQFYFTTKPEEFWGQLAGLTLFSINSIFFTITIFLLFIIRKYFEIFNLILLKKFSKEVLKVHLQLWEIISSFNKIFSFIMGYSMYVNLFITTFTLFEIYDITIEGEKRSKSQIIFSVGFFIANVFFYSIVISFLWNCEGVWSEQRKSFLLLGRRKFLEEEKSSENFRKNLKKIYLGFLQFQAMEKKISWELFEFDFKFLCSVSKKIKN